MMISKYGRNVNKTPRPLAGARRCEDDDSSARDADVRRGETLGGLLDFELDLVAFIQVLVSFALDGAIMHEHVFAARALNESEALGSVEPLDRSFFHWEQAFLG